MLQVRWFRLCTRAISVIPDLWRPSLFLVFSFASIMSFRKLQGHGQLTVIAYGQGRVSSFGKQLLFWSGVCSN